MLSVNKLEKVIELEEQLRSEYQRQLDEKVAEVEQRDQQLAELRETIEGQQATIAKQLETITDLSGKTSVSQRTEQLNRELTNRTDKQQAEITDLKKRVKSLQKDLAEVRAENKTLTQYDPLRMKKNLEANKKKMAEKTRANDLLQKSLNRTKGENADLQRQVKELEGKLAELEPAEEPGQESEEAVA
jgi:chromosome segregation ATPase